MEGGKLTYRVCDQFGVALPALTRVMRDHSDLFADYETTVNGDVSFHVLDNALAGMTCDEAAEALGLEPVTVRDLCLRGRIRAFRYPERWRIPKREARLYQKARGGDADA